MAKITVKKLKIILAPTVIFVTFFFQGKGESPVVFFLCFKGHDDKDKDKKVRLAFC